MELPVVTTFDEAKIVIWDQAEKIEKLSTELAWLKRQIFGSKAERFLPVGEETPPLPGLEPSAEPEKQPETVQTVSAHERTVRKENALSEIPADLPREERIIDVPEEEREGLKLIGYAESERIAYRTGLYVIHFKRAKYADPEQPENGVITAPAAGDFFDTNSGRTRYDASFVAKVVADKVENSIPLERQARMFASEKLPVAPSTLEFLYKSSAELLIPLYDRMVELIMAREILHVDETFIKLQVKGSGKCKQAYLWCRVTGCGPPLAAFHFAPSRSQDVAEFLLGDYSGTIIRDSYIGYESLKQCEVACCWAHVRRRLVKAFDNGYIKAEEPLKLLRGLYAIERKAKVKAEAKGTETALFQFRKEGRRESRKLVKTFFELCRGLRETERPSSPVRDAVSYALNIEAELGKFLDDPKLNIDNNPAERLNRGVALIRKNSLFAGSEKGGRNMAVLYSFAASCKANGIVFRNYLEDILPRLASGHAYKEWHHYLCDKRFGWTCLQRMAPLFNVLCDKRFGWTCLQRMAPLFKNGTIILFLLKEWHHYITREIDVLYQ